MAEPEDSSPCPSQGAGSLEARLEGGRSPNLKSRRCIYQGANNRKLISRAGMLRETPQATD